MPVNAPIGSGSGSSGPAELDELVLPVNGDWLTSAPSDWTVENGGNATSISDDGLAVTVVHAATATDHIGGTLTAPRVHWSGPNGDAPNLPYPAYMDVSCRIRCTGTAGSGIQYAALSAWRNGTESNYWRMAVGRNGGNWTLNAHNGSSGSNDTSSLSQSDVDTDGVWLRLLQCGNMHVAMWAKGADYESLPPTHGDWNTRTVFSNIWPAIADQSYNLGFYFMDTGGNGFTALVDNIRFTSGWGYPGLRFES